MALSSSDYPQNPLPAVGAVVFLEGRVLLVRRGQPPSEGQWAIPGGRIQLGETMQQAAEREILEETGIVIRASDPVYFFDSIIKDEQNRVQYHYVIVDLYADYISGVPLPGDDATDARWVSASELIQLDVSAPTLDLLKRQFGFGDA